MHDTLNNRQDTLGKAMAQHTLTTLQRGYRRQLVPAAAIAAAIMAARHLHPPAAGAYLPLPELGPPLLVIAVAMAVAMPVLLRTVFAHRVQHRRRVSEAAFLRFQQHVIRCALTTPYLAAAASTLALPRLHAAGILLAALYAVYYHYPSRLRIAFDRRLFRVAEASHVAST